MAESTDPISAEQRKIAIQLRSEMANKINDVVRLVSISYLILYFAFLTQDGVREIGQNYMVPSFFVGVSGFVTVIFDYLQHFFGYQVADHAMNDKKNNHRFAGNSFKYAANKFFFYWKQLTCLVGAIALLWIFVSYNSRLIIEIFVA